MTCNCAAVLAAPAKILLPTKAKGAMPGPVLMDETSVAVADKVVDDAGILKTKISGSAEMFESAETKAKPPRTSRCVSGVVGDIGRFIVLIIGTDDVEISLEYPPLKSVEQTGMLEAGINSGTERLSTDALVAKVLLDINSPMRLCARSKLCLLYIVAAENMDTKNATIDMATKTSTSIMPRRTWLDDLVHMLQDF